MRFSTLVGLASSVLALSSVTGCAIPTTPRVATTGSAEWGPGTTDVRAATALIRVTPPARLKATFETIAARSDDADFADFLRMHSGGGFGSGFLMVHHGAEGSAAFVVTNRHVISESSEAEVSFSDGTTYKACDVVFSSPKYDLAVLALPESAMRAVGNGLRPAARDATDRLSVVATGFPGVAGRPSYQITDGKVSNANFTLPGLGLDGTYVQHTAAIDPGSSGGPLTDESGALVGVNVMLMRQRASMFFAVPSSAVIETVRHAHSLSTKRRSAEWMAAELDKACTSLSAELGSSAKSGDRLVSFVSNAALADRGFESMNVLVHTSVASAMRQDFFRDPLFAMRRSIIIRLGVRASIAGGATGACAPLHPGDAATLGEGKPVRRAISTKNGNVELSWTFEHGSWRIAGGDLVDAATLTVLDAASAPPPPVKPSKSSPSSSKSAPSKTSATSATGAKEVK